MIFKKHFINIMCTLSFQFQFIKIKDTLNLHKDTLNQNKNILVHTGFARVKIAHLNILCNKIKNSKDSGKIHANKELLSIGCPRGVGLIRFVEGRPQQPLLTIPI